MPFRSENIRHSGLAADVDMAVDVDLWTCGWHAQVDYLTEFKCACPFTQSHVHDCAPNPWCGSGAGYY